MEKIVKEQMPILAYATTCMIRGNISTPLGSRISDFITGLGQKKFIPVTDAVVTDAYGKEICRTNLLILNKDEVIFFISEKEM